MSISGDVRDPATGSQVVEAAIERFGRIDVVVYAAGWNVPKRSIYDTSIDSWNTIIDTNLTGAFNVTRAAVTVMGQRGGGLIVYISSSGAKRPDQSGVAYQASKAGMAALAYATREECKDVDIRTTVIYPGTTETPFLEHRPAPPTPEMLGKVLQPEDVVAACSLVINLPSRTHVPELSIYPARS
jgi:NADP-dependent 3-hydroxy acid dehydrogenase YdfG